jgi:putative mRNA 3-end processing factor
MFDIRVLGAGREVGRSSIRVDTGSEKFLLDYGIEVQKGMTPIQPPIDLTAVLLSHSHLDHSGLLPELYKRGYAGSVYALPVAFDLCDILLHDSIKVQEKRKLRPQYLPHDIKKMMHLRKEVSFGQRMPLGRSTVTFYDAGHVPGSASIMLENAGRKLLYTGDINFLDTTIMKEADSSMSGVNVLVSEATYSYKDHPDRRKLAAHLKDVVKETLDGGGIAMLPCFAVGRAQELLTILSELGIPIVIDGMGIDASEAILNNPGSVRDAAALRRAFSHAKKVAKRGQRDTVTDRPCAVITTAGMLNGGPIGHYVKKFYMREDCALLLTGYQVEGTVGNILVKTGHYKNEGLNVKIQNRFESMDFSAHADRTHLLSFYKKINPEKIVIVHGDHNPEFANELNGMGFDAVAPGNGEKVFVK